jgi:hypothetical protein
MSAEDEKAETKAFWATIWGTVGSFVLGPVGIPIFGLIAWNIMDDDGEK